MMYFLKNWKKNTCRYHYLQLCTKNLNDMIYSSCDCIDNYGSFFDLLLLPPPLKNPKNQTFEKMKKIVEYLIISHMCTKNHNHMRYGFWDMECDRHNFLPYWAIFCSFTPLLTLLIKIWKKSKKFLVILSFYTCVPQMMIIWCMVPEIWSVTDRYFLTFWGIFCPFTPLSIRKIKILKTQKKFLEKFTIRFY